MDVKFASIFVLLLLFQSIDSWKGQVCTRMIATFGLEKRCAYRNWSEPCYHWRSVLVNKYIPQKLCCNGWRTSTHQNCDRAICLPECKNGGKCTSPGICSCVEGWKGTGVKYKDIVEGSKQTKEHLDMMQSLKKDLTNKINN